MHAPFIASRFLELSGLLQLSSRRLKIRVLISKCRQRCAWFLIRFHHFDYYLTIESGISKLLINIFRRLESSPIWRFVCKENFRSSRRCTSLLLTSQPNDFNFSMSKESLEPSPRPLLRCCFSIIMRQGAQRDPKCICDTAE